MTADSQFKALARRVLPLYLRAFAEVGAWGWNREKEKKLLVEACGLGEKTACGAAADRLAMPKYTGKLALPVSVQRRPSLLLAWDLAIVVTNKTIQLTWPSAGLYDVRKGYPSARIGRVENNGQISISLPPEARPAFRSPAKKMAMLAIDKSMSFSGVQAVFDFLHKKQLPNASIMALSTRSITDAIKFRILSAAEKKFVVTTENKIGLNLLKGGRIRIVRIPASFKRTQIRRYCPGNICRTAALLMKVLRPATPSRWRDLTVWITATPSATLKALVDVLGPLMDAKSSKVFVFENWVADTSKQWL